ncbi:hypothetical protein [Ralstonia solanacearum]|uniref:hypothetical protein n=1 Tax=Ralstonia solanacearum TaxID=305 RepID=UPI0005ACE7B2|nr:hypothetical protein [Ralstonia solanacearum]
MTAPFFGWLADRCGYKRVLSGAALLIFILAYPLYSYLNHAPAAGSLICVQIVFGLLSAAYTGPIPAAFADLFPTRVLSTGLSTAYNLTVMLIGGFAPFYLTFLSHTFDPTLAPVAYVMIAALVSSPVRYGCAPPLTQARQRCELRGPRELGLPGAPRN